MSQFARSYDGFRKLRPTARGLAATVALVGFVASCVFLLVEHTGLRYGSVIFLFPVVVAATQWGLVCALLAVILGVLSAAFFFYPPIYTLHLADPRELINLTIYTFIAIVTSHLASRFKEQLLIMGRREIELSNLYTFARRLALSSNALDIHGAVEDHLATLIQRKVVLFSDASSASNGEQIPRPEAPESVRNKLAEVASGSAGLMVTTSNRDTWLIRPMSPRPEFRVIAINLGDKPPKEIDDLRIRIDTVIEDAAATLERLGVSQAISEAQVRTRTDRLRDALIDSVSHGLRTPLASILGAASVLSAAPALHGKKKLQALAATVREEAWRLNNDIQNLLDATRISNGDMTPKLEWADLTDIINSAIERCRHRLAERSLGVDAAIDLPLIYVDPVLVRQALIQVIDNAAKYSSANSKIEVTASCDHGRVVVNVSDEGAGLTPEEQTQMWKRFSRGDRHVATTSGSGLGLWIASAFVRATGGKISATSDGSGCGTCVHIELPAAEAPPPATWPRQR